MKDKAKAKKNTCKERTAKNYCTECKMHIRGKKHNEGDIHKKGGKGKKLGVGF